MLRQPHAEADPQSEREEAHDDDRKEASCTAGADLSIIQHSHCSNGSDSLEDDEHNGVETAGADVEVER